MSENSARLGLPYLLPSQAQKHVTHNEALLQLDGIVQLSVVSFDAETPPLVPEVGETHALAAAPTGDWAGQGGALALRDDTAWRFLTPQEGWRAWGITEREIRVYSGGTWITSPDFNNLDGLGVGTSWDAENPLSVSSPATLFSHDGNGHQMKINKAAEEDTASLLYQSGWTGHAEIGLSGSNDLQVKVSVDGSSWTEALMIDRTTGVLRGDAVQDSPLDVTSGRVLKMRDYVGPFDLGSSRTSVVSGSLDAVLEGGVTRFMAWNTGATEVPWNYGVGLQIMAFDTTGNQLAFRRGSAPAMAFRSTATSTPTFSDWFELFHTGNAVGTVFATPGVGSALVERGSNANGSYMRLIDGTQICWHALTLDAPDTAAGAGFEGATETAWTFPAVFATGHLPVVSGSDGSDTRLMIGAMATSSSAAALRAMRFVASTTAPVVQAVAVGTWK